MTDNDTQADENTPVNFDKMIGHYKRSKSLAKKNVHEIIANRNLPTIIVNPSMPPGSRDIRPTSTGRMVLDAACGRMPAYVDTGFNFA